MSMHKLSKFTKPELASQLDREFAQMYASQQLGHSATAATDDRVSALRGQIFLGVLVVLAVVALCYFLIPTIKRRREEREQELEAQRMQFEVADYSIPHCEFQKTANGFIVSFKRSKEAGAIVGSAIEAGGPFLLIVVLVLALVGILWLYADFGVPGMVVGIVLEGAVVYWSSKKLLGKLAPTTTIEVTKDAVIFNEKRYRRSEFPGINVEQVTTVPGAPIKLETLSFTHGTKKVPIPGGWVQPQGTEFCSAFNRYLREIPQTGDEYRPTAEQLRSAARSSDF